MPTSLHLHAMKSPISPLLNTLETEYQQDSISQDIIQQLTTDPIKFPDWTYKQPFLYNKNRMYIPQTSKLRQELISTAHDSFWGRHSGIKGTLFRLKQQFYWPNMINDITEYISKCVKNQNQVIICLMIYYIQYPHLLNYGWM